jgi:hypothetical protein
VDSAGKASVTITLGLICTKTGFSYTSVDNVAGTIDDGEIGVPPTKIDRGAQLDWLLAEASRLLETLDVSAVAVKHSSGGAFAADPARYEVEGVVQVAAFRAGVACALLNTEQARAKMGVKKATGAYADLLNRSDIKVRSNKVKRECYVYALVAAESLDP